MLSWDRYSLHINCGGAETTIGNIVYQGDQYEGGAAKFHPMSDNWGFSSTGHFWDHSISINDYIAQNVSVLRMNNSGLYTRARLSPLSLTYYGRCLANGNYTVKLHFAEIIFRSNRSFYSLGRRIFDVYIQVGNIIILFWYIVEDNLIKRVCCRTSWNWRILILNMQQEESIRQL